MASPEPAFSYDPQVPRSIAGGTQHGKAGAQTEAWLAPEPTLRLHALCEVTQCASVREHLNQAQHLYVSLSLSGRVAASCGKVKSNE